MITCFKVGQVKNLFFFGYANKESNFDVKPEPTSKHFVMLNYIKYSNFC